MTVPLLLWPVVMHDRDCTGSTASARIEVLSWTRAPIVIKELHISTEHILCLQQIVYFQLVLYYALLNQFRILHCVFHNYI